MKSGKTAPPSLDTGQIDVQSMDITLLVPYERNAKKHSQKQINDVANSIHTYGWRQPLVIDGNNVIVIGHCRYLAAKQLGLSHVPVVIADDLTPAQIRELRIVDNKINESPWDYQILDLECDGLEFSGFDFDFCIEDPFSDKELEELMSSEVERRSRSVHRVVVDCNNVEETAQVEELLKNNGYNPQVRNT